MKKTYTYKNAAVETFVFDNGNEVKEAHVMIHATDPTAPFSQQLSAMAEALNSLSANELKDFHPVFKRYFLSDAANQEDEVRSEERGVRSEERGESSEACAVSIIEQPPLDGTKVAMWCYLMTDVKTSQLESGLYSAKCGSYRHLWGGSAHNLAANSEYQTQMLFDDYIKQLEKEGCTLKDNCIRTWFFVNDVDLNYGGVVRARNRTFFTQGLTNDTHFIASTGIGGRQADPNVLTQMDTYAISGISPSQVKHLYAPTHLNRTSDYGVSFERGTMIDYCDRRHVFISGTASIDNLGQIVHPKDIVRQTDRMIENVEALLKEAECGFDNVGQMIVYLRDISDYAVVSRTIRHRFPDIPKIIVHAPVCRPGWLIEMECIAICKSTS